MKNFIYIVVFSMLFLNAQAFDFLTEGKGKEATKKDVIIGMKVIYIKTLPNLMKLDYLTSDPALEYVKDQFELDSKYIDMAVIPVIQQVLDDMPLDQIEEGEMRPCYLYAVQAKILAESINEVLKDSSQTVKREYAKKLVDIRADNLKQCKKALSDWNAQIKSLEKLVN